MLKAIKIGITVILLACAVIVPTYLLQDKFIIITKSPQLVASTPKSYLLTLYARYQLQPDIKQLQNSLKLLAATKLSQTQQEQVTAMITYLDNLPEYSEAKLVQLVQKLKLQQVKAKKISFMGLDLSNVVTEKHDEALIFKKLLVQLQWAIHVHDAQIYQTTLAMIERENLVKQTDVLQQLKTANVTPPELPWQEWIQKIQGIEHA